MIESHHAEIQVVGRDFVVCDILEKLLNEINVCHQHSAAAISFAAQLVHRITAEPSVAAVHRIMLENYLPVRDSVVDELQVTFP